MIDEIQAFESEFDGLNVEPDVGGGEKVPLLSAAPQPIRQETSAPAPRADDSDSSVVFVAGRGRQNEDMKDAGSNSLQAYADIDTPELFPPGYTPPGLAEAAREAGIRDADAVAAKCLRKAQMDKSAGLYDAYELDVEDAATILMYTADRGGDLHEWSPYLVINQALDTRDPQLLFATRHLIWKLLAALRKLPRVYGKSLFRGITKELHYSKGETVCWHRFTSTTLDLAVTKNFMAMAAGAGSEAKGTIFLMSSHECWGYDIRPFSFFPAEEELLLEPESLFTVESQSSVNSLIMCQLGLVPHPLLLEKRITVGGLAAESIRTVFAIDKNVREPAIHVVDGSIGYNSVQVEWDDVISVMPSELSNSAFYEVMVKEEAGTGQPKMLPRTRDNHAKISVLLPEKRYQIKCRVNFGQNVTNWAQCVFKTTPMPVLSPVLIMQSLTFNSFVVTWDDVVDRTIATQQEQQYVVQLSINDKGFSNYSNDAGTPFKIDGLSDGDNCRVRVKLVLMDSETGERVDGPFSEELVVRTFSMPVPILSVKDRSFSSMTVHWGTVDPSRMLPVDAPAGSYEVQWKDKESGWKHLFNGANPSIDLRSLEPGRCYQFRARYCIPGKTSEWSQEFSQSTSEIPTPDVSYDPVTDIPRVSSHITNLDSFHYSLSDADFAKIQFEYRVSDLSLGGNVKTFMANGANFSRSLTPNHKFSVMCRVVIDSVYGQWSEERLLEMPESYYIHVMSKISSFLVFFLWEFGILIALFGLLYCFGQYIEDESSTTGLQVMCIIMLVLFGSMFFFPIGVLHWDTQLSPLSGLFMLPLTKLKNSQRNSGAKFYCVMLLLQYVGVIGSLVLLLLRTFGIDSIYLFMVSIPVSFAFTFVPAIMLPALFWFRQKGRFELLGVYTLLFPFWGPLMLASAQIDGIMEIDTTVMFIPMFVAFAVNVCLFFWVICAEKADKDNAMALLGCVFVFGIPVTIPTYLVMPILIGLRLNPEEDTEDYLLQNLFAPLYIDIIIGCAISFFSYLKSIKATDVSEVIKPLVQISSPCWVCNRS